MIKEKHDDVRMNHAFQFLNMLWEGKEEEDHVLIWTLKDKQSRWFTEVQDAAEYASQCDTDTYIGVSTSPDDRGPHARCPAQEVSSICGLWVDLDYAHPDAHKQPSNGGLHLPEDEGQARMILDRVGIAPTVLVHSGYGLQAWWLLKAPQTLSNAFERDEAARWSEIWQRTIQGHAADLGYRVDYTGDLARIMRVPGTFNCKGKRKRPVKILEVSGLRIAEFSDLEMYLYDRAASAGRDARAEMHIESGKAKPWSHWEKVLGGVSEGERNTALASLCGKLLHGVRDIEDSEYCKLLLHNVLAVNERFKPPLDQNEVVSTFQSIWKAEEKRRHKEAEEFKYSERFAELAQGVVDKPTDAMVENVRQLLGGLRLIKVIKMGRQKSDYLFKIEGDDEDIEVGNILNQSGMRRCVMDATRGSVMIPFYSQKNWASVCAKIAAIAEEHTVYEENDIVELALEKYFSSRAMYSEDELHRAIPNRWPFRQEGRIWVSAPDVLDFLSIQKIQGVDRRKLHLYFHENGWHIDNRVARDTKGNQKCRSYWSCPEHLVPEFSKHPDSLTEAAEYAPAAE